MNGILADRAWGGRLGAYPVFCRRRKGLPTRAAFRAVHKRSAVQEGNHAQKYNGRNTKARLDKGGELC